jgi:hypothetical protein
MLNADAHCTTIGDFAGPIPRPCFVRPVHDTKGFTGNVFDDPSWQEFRDGVLAVADDASRPTVTEYGNPRRSSAPTSAFQPSSA